MAGNDGDLLKQATQAMMARYESEKHISLCIERHTNTRIVGLVHFPSGTILHVVPRIYSRKTVQMIFV